MTASPQKWEVNGHRADRDTTIMHRNRHEQLFQPKVRMQCGLSRLLDNIQEDTQGEWRRDVVRDGVKSRRSGEIKGSLTKF